jgi:polyisoprenoid-binding protein YceI
MRTSTSTTLPVAAALRPRLAFVALALAGLLLLLFMAPPARAETWTIDPDHSAAHFSIRHMMIAQVRGSFPAVSGSIELRDGAPVAFDVTVDVNSLSTGVKQRDDHLKSADFFEAATHPAMTFRSTAVEPGAGGFLVSGVMTVKGTAREVTLLLTGLDDARTDPWGNVRRGATALFTLDRRDYGIVWNAPLDGGGWMVGNEVEVAVDLEAIGPKK